MVGNSTMFDALGRSYPLRQGDVLLVKSGARHTGTYDGTMENIILGITTPPRSEFQAEDGKAYFPGHEIPESKLLSALSQTDDQEPPVRVLFNINDVHFSTH